MACINLLMLTQAEAQSKLVIVQTKVRYTLLFTPVIMTFELQALLIKSNYVYRFLYGQCSLLLYLDFMW